MYNYCTLFDSFYLSRALAMYDSLLRTSGPFHLYIFTFDQISYDVLIKLDLAYITLISLDEFEDPDLLHVKKDRSKGEYCWTCTPSIIKYSLEKFNLDSCTYIDADLYFFNDPSTLIDEMGEKSILLTEHRYTPEYDQSSTSGIYCVQFMCFKNDRYGMEALTWWREACLDWCYARIEDGKFGDQKYLDDWMSRFKGVHVLENKYGAVAPWNVQQYSESELGNAVFYHFHATKYLTWNSFDFGRYSLSKPVLKHFYKTYIKALRSSEEVIFSADIKINRGFFVPSNKTGLIRDALSQLIRSAKGINNIYLEEEILRF